MSSPAPSAFLHMWWDETQDGKRKSQGWTLALLPCSNVELMGPEHFKAEPVLPGIRYICQVGVQTMFYLTLV